MILNERPKVGGNGKSLHLSELEWRKFPLRYGTESCYITLTDDLYTDEIVEMRNTASLGKYINYVELSAKEHRLWLTGQLDRDDALNFVLVIRQKFAGTLSLYKIEPGIHCELGRVMMPQSRHFYAPVVDLLGISFAIEILGADRVYCVVDERNTRVLKSQLNFGWKLDARYDRMEIVNGRPAHLVGLSVDRPEWARLRERFRPLVKRLFAEKAHQTSEPVSGRKPNQVYEHQRSVGLTGMMTSRSMNGYMVHPLADVSTENIGEGTRIWQYAVVLPKARIGADCNICAHVFVENDVVVGDRVTIKSGVQLWDGLRVSNDVFIGPNATFTNDMFPRSRSPHICLETVIEAGASIGAGAIILPGLTIGSGAMVAAGAVVTRNVEPRSLVRGNPARHVRFLEQ